MFKCPACLRGVIGEQAVHASHVAGWLLQFPFTPYISSTDSACTYAMAAPLPILLLPLAMVTLMACAVPCFAVLCWPLAVQLSHLDAFFPGAAGPSSSSAAAARQAADMVAEFEQAQVRMGVCVCLYGSKQRSWVAGQEPLCLGRCVLGDGGTNV